MNIPKWIQATLRSRFLRIVTIGAIGFIVQTIIFEVLGIYLQIVPPSTAVLLGAETGILTNFYLNNRFSFHDRQHNASYLSRLARFHIVVSGSVLLQYVFVFITERQTSNQLLVSSAYLAGVMIGFAWNYTFYHLFVWGKKEYREQSTLPYNLT
jgi:dolichol-phosphate mannosyltransferase